MPDQPQPAPLLHTTQWFNANAPIALEALRGQIVLIEAFQMLCPGCVSNGLPQAMRVHDAFGKGIVKVLGLHTVFEHHQAMPPESLEAFLYEYKISFPVGVDEPGDGKAIPKTMEAYQMQGTPTLILIDKFGRRRAQHFGHVPDLQLGAEIMSLQLETRRRLSTGPGPDSDSMTSAGDTPAESTLVQLPATGATTAPSVGQGDGLSFSQL